MTTINVLTVVYVGFTMPGMTGPRNPAQTKVLGNLGDDTAGSVELPESTEHDELSAAITELGGNDATVRCLKWGRAPSGEEGWLRCCKVPVDGFDPDRIAVQYGPGKYRFSILDGRGRPLKHQIISFAAPQTVAPTAPHQEVRAAGGAAPFSFEQLYLSQQQFQQSIILALIQSFKGGGGDVKMSDVLNAVKIGREMGTGGADAKTLFESVRSAVDLARELGGGGSGEPKDLLTEIAPQVLSLIQDGLAHARVAREHRAAAVERPSVNHAAPAAALTPGPKPAAVNTPPAAGPPRPVRMNLDTLARSYAGPLLQEAQEDRDPEVWGVWLAERIPDQFVPTLLELVEANPEDRFDLLCKYAPGLVDHREWIDEAAAAIADTLSEKDNAFPGTTDGNNETAGGRGGDVAQRGSDPAVDSVGGAPPDSAPLRGVDKPGVRAAG